MIESTQELMASLQYMQRWADLLEGLRRVAQETSDTTLLPVTTEGPLSEIRRILAEASVYTKTLSEVAEGESILSLNGSRERAA